jgi:hypothetical protein
MKTVICINNACAQNGIEEYFMGSPNLVMCGVCQTACQLSEEYNDPQQPVMGQASEETPEP